MFEREAGPKQRNKAKVQVRARRNGRYHCYHIANKRLYEEEVAEEKECLEFEADVALRSGEAGTAGIGIPVRG